MVTGIRQHLVQAILDANRKAANQLIATWMAAHGFEQTLADLIDPALKIIARWEHTADVSLAQAYVAGKIAENFTALFTYIAPRPDRFQKTCQVFNSSTVVNNAV